MADWNDDRGFGFIEPADQGPRVFVHVSAFLRGPRPVVGALVTYAELRDGRGRARAGAVQYVTRPPGGMTRPGRMLPSLVLVAAFAAVLAGLAVLEGLPLTALAIYVLMSSVSFVVYGQDKKAAQRGTWRTSESTLHLLALAGGWPGAAIARPFFRHKTTKQPFRTVFWLTVVANLSVLVWFVHESPVSLP